MTSTIDISYIHMLLGFLLLLIPLYFLYYYRTGLIRETIIAAVRMTVQLFFIGFYLEYLFTWNNIYINILWVLIMIGIASYTILQRTKLPVRQLLTPVISAFLCALFFIDIYFLGVVIRPPNLLEARYFIPISGMILGNMLSANVIALNAFYGSIDRERQLYFYLLGNGASKNEALSPFMKEALIKSFNPTIASMAVMGLIALPGTMTGQILGGSSPNVAIKYQIMLMVTIFASSLISVLITLWTSSRRAFDEFGMKKF
ncbi:ABC transporter permease [Barnesiella propionica]|uniref:ABC transporter permease n=1 Tax=Barnesiella propionica TaxID=2981781 RepID=UPI0011C86DFB|nr:ABC transporter permease [Barnesiella propionica]MCU6767973.1 ABC transporter permease [Barnesiella propionica]